jgi:hypothetical protein
MEEKYLYSFYSFLYLSFDRVLEVRKPNPHTPFRSLHFIGFPK